MITCKLTGNIGEGVKAHIIPKAFYEISPQEKRPHRLLSNVEGFFPKKMPVGIYDSTIVTKEGEDIFESWDSYSARILLNETDKFEEMIHNEKIEAWSLSNYNYSKLKLFVLSIFWRAHASTHSTFSKFSLGPHETPIKKMLLNNQAGTPEEYSVNIERWLDDDCNPTLMNPNRYRINGVNYCRVYCGRYIFHVKNDKRPTHDKIRQFQLRPDNKLYLFSRDLRECKEYPIMKKIAEDNRHLLTDSVKPS